MTHQEIFEAIYTALAAALPGVVWQQPNQDKPAAGAWGVIQYDGEAPVNLAMPGYSYVYYRIWIYSTSKNGTDLLNLAGSANKVLDNEYITSPAGKIMRFMKVNISPLYYADEYQAQAIDMTFRATMTN